MHRVGEMPSVPPASSGIQSPAHYNSNIVHQQQKFCSTTSSLPFVKSNTELQASNHPARALGVGVLDDQRVRPGTPTIFVFA